MRQFRLARNCYRGTFGDQINVMLAAAAYNFKKWMRLQMQAMMKKNPTLNPFIGAW